MADLLNHDLLKLAASDPHAAADKLDLLAADLEGRAKHLRTAARRLREMVAEADSFRSSGYMGDVCTAEVVGPDGRVKGRSTS